MSSESLSAQLKISGTPFAPREILEQLLSGISQALGNSMLGHIKGVAHFPAGVLYASTVGVPPVVNFEVYGQIPETTSTLEFELACIVFGMTRQRVQQAVEQAMAALPDDLQLQGQFYGREHQH